MPRKTSKKATPKPFTKQQVKDLDHLIGLLKAYKQSRPAPARSRKVA